MLNQWQLCLFLLIFFAINAVLAGFRANEFVGMRNIDGSRPNLFYMVSRACGIMDRGFKIEPTIVGPLFLLRFIT